MKINFNTQRFGAKIVDNHAARELKHHFDYQPENYEFLKCYDRFCISLDCILPNDTDIVTFNLVEEEPNSMSDIVISGTISRNGDCKDFFVTAPIDKGAPNIHCNIIQAMKRAIKPKPNPRKK